MFIQEQLSKGNGWTRAFGGMKMEAWERETLISGSVKPRRRGPGGVYTCTHQRASKRTEEVMSAVGSAASHLKRAQ